MAPRSDCASVGAFKPVFLCCVCLLYGCWVGVQGCVRTLEPTLQERQCFCDCCVCVFLRDVCLFLVK